MKQKELQLLYEQQQIPDYLGDQKQIVGVLDGYLSRHIEFVKESRSNEVKVLEKIKNSLKEKLGEIKVTARDLPRRSLGVLGSTGRRKFESKRRTSEMESFESQISQCDKLLRDLGFKCREYASGDYGGRMEKKIKVKTEPKGDEGVENGSGSGRKLPLLKLRNRTEEIETQPRKKYDHVGDALLVVPTQIGDMGSADKRSAAPTSRSNRQHRSRKQSIDTKSIPNIVLSKPSINPQQSILIKKSRKSFSKTIEVQHTIQPIKNPQLYSTRNTPKQLTNEPPSNLQTLENNEQIDQKIVKQYQQSIVQAFQPPTNDIVSLPNHDESKETKNDQKQVKSISQIKNEQTQANNQQKQINTLVNQIKNEQKQQSESLRTFTKRQKSMIPHLSQAKMRGLKLYERIRQYKAKNI